MADIRAMNEDGDWIPDIPIPLFHLFLKRCPVEGCRTGWFSMAGYRGHYALRHICKLPDRPG